MNRKESGADIGIVEALFARSIAGVYARRSSGGRVLIRHTWRAPWPLRLGLAVRVQNAAAQAALDTSLAPSVRSILNPYGDDEVVDLEWVTTDRLIAELFQVVRGEWVLGLFRPKKQDGHWSGVCWNGSAVGCSGVAAVLVEAIQSKVFAGRMKNRRGAFDPMADVVELMNYVLEHASDESPSKTWMAGTLQMAEHVIRQSGSQRIAFDDLASFVQIDGKDQ